MKKLFLASALMATLLLSCTDNDDPKSGTIDLQNPDVVNLWSGIDAQLWDVTRQYVEQVVFPTYENLAIQADLLYSQASSIQTKFSNGTLTDDDIAKACDLFAASRYYWERSEAFLYGAATDFNIDPHIDSWPLDQEQMTQFFASEQMVAGITGEDPIGFVSSHNAEFDTALGFHGIEYIIFREGSPRRSNAFTANEVAFLTAVAGDLRDHCFQLEVAWKGLDADPDHRQRVEQLGLSTCAMGNHGYYYGADLLLAGYYNSDSRYQQTTYSSMPAVVANILLGGCSNICAEVADQKMGQAWRVLNGNGTAEDAADYIESPYSKHSFIDYQGNIYSIQNSLYGNLDAAVPHGNSIISFLAGNGYEGTVALKEALANALGALQACIDSGVAFVDDPGNIRVKNAIDAVTQLDNELNKAALWISRL